MHADASATRNPRVVVDVRSPQNIPVLHGLLRDWLPEHPPDIFVPTVAALVVDQVLSENTI